MIRAKAFLAVALLGLAVLRSEAARGDDLITLDTRPGVKQSFLLLEPKGMAKGTAKGVVIVLPGHEGEVKFNKTANGGYELINYGGKGGGLTVQRPMRETLRNSGFVVAMITPPSDRTRFSPQFRKSAEHLADMRGVIDYLRARYGKVYLQGHCLSTLSAASVASGLRSDGISGMILSSTRSTGKDGSVTDFERGSVKVPVLLVHHRDDSCPQAPYRNIEAAVKPFYESAAPKVDIVTVTGGDKRLKKKEDSCKDGLHGFKGMEKETAQAIVSWLLDEKFPAHVDGTKK